MELRSLSTTWTKVSIYHLANKTSIVDKLINDRDAHGTEGHKHGHELATSMAELKKKTSCCPNMTPFILMIALSVHSVFEGLALGLATTEASVVNMLIAICIHKGAASSSLGISLVKTFPNDFSLCRKLITVFGAGGDRDTGKRPEMGAVAVADSDIVIVTDDNPRSEDPSLIRADVMAGAPGAHEIGDRRYAIAFAIEHAEPDDIVLIAGKGHEQGQIIMGRVLPFDDVEVARECAA